MADLTLPDDGYAQAADVTRRTGKTYGSGSRPTETGVQDFIKERARLINGVLKARGFDVPIPASSPEASEILKGVNVLGAAGDAENAYPAQEASSGRAQNWLKEFYDQLKMLKSPDFDLIDAPTDSSTSLSRLDQEPDGQFALDASGDEREPWFDRDTQW